MMTAFQHAKRSSELMERVEEKASNMEDPDTNDPGAISKAKGAYEAQGRVVEMATAHALAALALAYTRVSS